MSEPYAAFNSPTFETERDTDNAVSSRRSLPMMVMIATFMVAAIGCGGDDPASGITITDARMAVPTTDDGAIYLTVANRGDRDDQLVGATTKISPMTHLHRSSIDDSGRAGMDMVARVPVPAGSTVKLEPGGVHLMVMSPEPVAVGGRFDLTVMFRDSSPVRTTVEVVAVVEPKP